jgi:hypothetical protein
MVRKLKQHNPLRNVKIVRFIREQSGVNGVFVAECTEGAIRVGVRGWQSTTSKLPQYLDFAKAAPGLSEADFEAGVYDLMSSPQTEIGTRKK